MRFGRAGPGLLREALPHRRAVEQRLVPVLGDKAESVEGLAGRLGGKVEDAVENGDGEFRMWMMIRLSSHHIVFAPTSMVFSPRRNKCKSLFNDLFLVLW